MCPGIRGCNICLARRMTLVKTQDEMEVGISSSTPNQFEVERRIKPRIYRPFHAMVRGVNAGGEAFEASTVLDNMSSGGLYLRVEQNVMQGAEISVIIRLSTKTTDPIPVANVAVEGVVVRNDVQPSGLYGLGISISTRRFVS